MQDKSAAGGGFTLRVAASFNPSFNADPQKAGLLRKLFRFLRAG